MNTKPSSANSVLSIRGFFDGCKGVLNQISAKAVRGVATQPRIERWTFEKSTQRLRELQAVTDSLEEVLETRRMYNGWGVYRSIQASQDEDEEAQLYDLVMKDGPEVVLEIGTERGGTLYPWCRPCTSPDVVISIDINYLGRRENFYQVFVDGSDTQLHLLKGNSHHESQINRVKNVLSGSEIDYLFIDGDHTYEGVRKDFEMYSPLVRGGGLVAFHDINGDHSKCGVGKFWQEVEGGYESYEFVSDESGIWGGIGVLRMGDSR